MQNVSVVIHIDELDEVIVAGTIILIAVGKVLQAMVVASPSQAITLVSVAHRIGKHFRTEIGSKLSNETICGGPGPGIFGVETSFPEWT
jgi:hypothetical protein